MSFIEQISNFASHNAAGMSMASGLLGSVMLGSGWATMLIQGAVLGMLAEGSRRLLSHLQRILYEAIFPTAFVDSKDPSFLWILQYMAQSPSVQAQLKVFRLATADQQESSKTASSVQMSLWYYQPPVRPLQKHNATFEEEGVVASLSPINERWIKIYHRGNTIWIKRSDGRHAGSHQKTADHLQIATLWYQSRAIKLMLFETRKRFYAKTSSELQIFHQQWGGRWCPPVTRPTRDWDSIILPETTKDDLLRDIKNFFSDKGKNFYAARGIPHRRGYLLHGAPGAGKTTLACAIASKLKLDMYIVNPAAADLDDDDLRLQCCSCPRGSMLLIEDIDCAMPKRRPQNSSGKDDDSSKGAEDDKTNRSKVTLSGLLNAIDGVSSQEDCILVATTNHADRLDHALVRPGRFDVKIEFFDATPEQARRLFLHFFPTDTFTISDGVSSDEGFTSSEKSALPNGKMTNGDAKHAHMSDGLESREGLADRFSQALSSVQPFSDGTTFTVSMAALQGYLLDMNRGPVEAVDGVSGWLEKLWTTENEKILKGKKGQDEESKKSRPGTPC